mmetsp:Transcript_33960/g.54070  ORF Transcript_33960/g.54070 Transcript_33960/m.54070 type:complete len:153 (-) Transcript_33960:310-768(-)|eukprot:CAMPEP_0169119538 /NCGR_PEP_ID=MMETSP1015-20121227/31615_1 /TAXON_ID=342587 /ORGANISM="Karlodinium micrum, Strain CCMP2283" /LENGTH=152 /DNA_ID=CAMNT_0009182435 /DNA_START=56 /DNA_END=517 /DNA_ORIENTATION=-
MGNTCAQECSTHHTPRGGDATIDFNTEHAPSYPAAGRSGKSAHTDDLPRLGLGSVMQCFQKSVKRPCLNIVFVSNGEEKWVQVYRRPLGAEFIQSTNGPITVSKIHPESYAGELGIEPGWSLKAIAGENMGGKSFEEAQGSLKNGLMLLPTV